MPNEETGHYPDVITGHVKTRTEIVDKRGPLAGADSSVSYFDAGGRLVKKKIFGFMGGITFYEYDSLGLLSKKWGGSCGESIFIQSYFIDDHFPKMIMRTDELHSDNDTAYHSLTTYFIDSAGKVTSILCKNKYANENKYIRYQYSGDRLSTIVTMSDRDTTNSDDTFEASYNSIRSKTFYYTSTKIDSTVEWYFDKKSVGNGFSLKVKYNKKGLPDSTFWHNKPLLSYRYTFYE